MSCGCGCAGAGGCGDGADAGRDGIALRLLADRAGQRIGLLAVWPQETRDLILRINPAMVSTNAAVKDCVGISAGERDAWAAFFASWQTFAAEEVTTFGSARKYDEAESYRAQLGGWQDELRDKCKIPGPRVSSEEPGSATVSAVKWASAAVIAAALVYGLRTVLR